MSRAVAAARAAFDSGPWPQTTAQERGRILFRLAERLRKEAATRLRELESRNSGKPIVEAEYDIADAATCFEYYGGMATKITGHVNPVPDNALSLSLREPVGVAGANHSLELSAADGGVEARSGDCGRLHLRLKPAEQTPLTALEFAAWLAEVGLPPGVVNIVTGFGETAGAPLVAHPDVNKIAFTGSAEVGKMIMKAAADTREARDPGTGRQIAQHFLRRRGFRGGHRRRAFGVFINQGEVCSAGQPHPGGEEDLPQDSWKRWPPRRRPSGLGAPLERETKMGPLVSKEQYDRVRSYQELGKKEAKLAAGGVAPRFRNAAFTSSPRFSTMWTIPRASPRKKSLGRSRR